MFAVDVRAMRRIDLRVAPSRQPRLSRNPIRGRRVAAVECAGSPSSPDSPSRSPRPPPRREDAERRDSSSSSLPWGPGHDLAQARPVPSWMRLRPARTRSPSASLGAHNFHLRGPGRRPEPRRVDGLVGRGRSRSATARTFFCDPHRGPFDRVGPSSGTHGDLRPDRRRRSSGTVGPSFTIAPAHGRHAVRSLKAGRYAITVRDRSRFHNFHLGAGINGVNRRHRGRRRRGR